MLKSSLAAFCPLLCLVVVSGCGESPPEVAPVEGIVRVKGKPQPGLMVRFLPDPEKGNQVSFGATGVTDEQGKYVLEYTYQGKQGNGAPVGWHRVLIVDTTRGYTRQGQTPRPSLIPLDYASPATTPLQQEVEPGPQSIDFDLGS